MALHTVQLPESLFRRLQQQAAGEQRSVDEYIEQMLKRSLSPIVSLEDDLPPALRAEFEAMSQFSDAALWVLAKGTLAAELMAEWDALIEAQAEGRLTAQAIQRKAALGREYDDMVLRRAHAAMLLHSRGYDLSDPATLHA